MNCCEALRGCSALMGFLEKLRGLIGPAEAVPLLQSLITGDLFPVWCVDAVFNGAVRLLRGCGCMLSFAR